jgi:hypothetical protein
VIYEYGESWWNDIDGKTEELREKPVPVPLYPPQFPHGLTQVGKLIWQFGCYQKPVVQ